MALPGSYAFRTKPCVFFAFGRGTCIKEDCRFAHILNGVALNQSHYGLPFKRQPEEDEAEPSNQETFCDVEESDFEEVIADDEPYEDCREEVEEEFDEATHEEDDDEVKAEDDEVKEEEASHGLVDVQEDPSKVDQWLDEARAERTPTFNFGTYP